MNANATEVIRQAIEVELYLESATGEAPESTLLEHLPFTIGRTEETDLTIPSIQVSREHATIYREGQLIRIRDNGSTNGTFVNSQRVTDVALANGDLLTIADFDLHFRNMSDNSTAAVATQVIPQQQTDTSDSIERQLPHAADLRRLQEMLTHGCVECGLRPLVALATNELVGVEAEATWPHQTACRRAMERALHDGTSSMSENLQHIEYLAAADEFDALADLSYLVLPAGADTIDSPRFHRLWQKLASARHSGAAGEESKIVIEIHDATPRNAAGLASLIETLHARNLLVGYAASSSSTAQIREFLEAGIDFIKLAEGMISGLHQHRQRERQVETAIGLCHSLGARVIAAGVNCGKEAEICRNLHCDFASGSYFGVSLPQNTDSTSNESFRREPLSVGAE